MDEVPALSRRSLEEWNRGQQRSGRQAGRSPVAGRLSWLRESLPSGGRAVISGAALAYLALHVDKVADGAGTAPSLIAFTLVAAGNRFFVQWARTWLAFHRIKQGANKDGGSATSA
jgi:hypothetical protein